MNPTRWCLVLGLAALIPAGSARAHDVWLGRDEEGLWLRYGHRDTDASSDSHRHTPGPASGEAPTYDPEIIERIDCFGVDGSAQTCAVRPSFPLCIACDCAATHVLLSWGYWTKTPYGTKNISRDQAEMPIRSWLSFEGVKRIDAWGDALAHPLTDDLEIVPLSDPFALGPGDKLRLRITLEGRPVQGAIVSYDDKPRGASDGEGRINVRLRHGGLQSLRASLTLPLEGARADEVVRTATLNFELEEPQ